MVLFMLFVHDYLKFYKGFLHVILWEGDIIGNIIVVVGRGGSEAIDRGLVGTLSRQGVTFLSVCDLIWIIFLISRGK